MVENGNQQHIYRWLKRCLLLPQCRGDYTDWEIHQSVEVRIFLKTSCNIIHDNFGVPKASLQIYLNAIFLELKRSSLKHLWYIICLGEINNKSVRNTITENIAKQKLGPKTHLLNYEEAYIVATKGIKVAHGLPRDTNIIYDELQQILHGVVCQDNNNSIKTHSALRCAH